MLLALKVLNSVFAKDPTGTDGARITLGRKEYIMPLSGRRGAHVLK